jgi:hypothetical protein
VKEKYVTVAALRRNYCFTMPAFSFLQIARCIRTVCMRPLLHTSAIQNPSSRLLAFSCRGISSKGLKTHTGRPTALWAAAATLATAAVSQLCASHHSIATAPDDEKQGARSAAERYSGEVDAEGRKHGFGKVI